MNTQGNAAHYSWPYFCQGKSIDDLKQSLLYTSLELEKTRVAAKEEIKKKEDQMIQLQDLLKIAIKERDEAQDNYKTLLMEKVLILKQQQPLSGVSSIEDELRIGDSYTAISSSDYDESNVSSPVAFGPFPARILQVGIDKPLPEKGKLLEAVMNAGPLLQTLLLAGPLPQWQNPPPPLNSFDIPSIVVPSSPLPPPLVHSHLLHHLDSTTTINIANSNNNNFVGRVNDKKRTLCEGSNISSIISKYQRRTLLH